MLRLGFVGAGKMAQALAKGFLAAGLTKGDNIVASCAPEDLHCVKAFKELGAMTTHNNIHVMERSEIVLLAVKPNVMTAVLSDIQPAVSSRHLILSVAMGVSLAQIEKMLPPNTRVVRAMPNTPALIQQGASVFVPGSAASRKDADVTRKLLEAVGTCDQVPEYFMDTITALSASGPAYVYVMIESLADGGVKMGLPRDLAYRLAAQTVVGAGSMVRDLGVHPGQLKDEVSSPAGSTCAGLHFLERCAVRAAFIGAVEEATNRCRAVTGSIS